MSDYEWFKSEAAYLGFNDLIIELVNAVNGWNDMPSILRKASTLYKGMQSNNHEFPFGAETSNLESSKSGRFLIKAMEEGTYQKDDSNFARLDYVRKHLAKFALNGLEISTLSRAGVLS